MNAESKYLSFDMHHGHIHLLLKNLENLRFCQNASNFDAPWGSSKFVVSNFYFGDVFMMAIHTFCEIFSFLAQKSVQVVHPKPLLQITTRKETPIGPRWGTKI